MTRFSNRLPWSTPRNSYTSLLEEKRKTGVRLIDLTISNPTAAFADYPHAEIAQALGAIRDFRYEPEPFGALPSRQAIANWYAAQQISVRPDRIALTASTSEAYAVLFKLLCDPGDEILIPCPSYPLFEYLASAEGVRTVPYRLDYDGAWFIDFESMQRAISARTKAIVIVNPNNPTGSYLKDHELRQLTECALSHRLALIADEVFMTYPATSQDGRVRTLIDRDDVLSFSLNGLSKAAGMPQMKAAWIVLNGPASELNLAAAKLELLLDNYLSVSAPVQKALPELLRIGGEMQDKIAARAHENIAALTPFRESALTPLATEGGWSAILQIPNIYTEQEWISRFLTDEDIVVQPGYFYDMAKEAYVVVSLIASPIDFSQGIQRLEVSVGNA